MCTVLDDWTKKNFAIKEKRRELVNCKGVVFHNDNVRPHTSLVTCQKSLTLSWKVISHPPHSPDFSPCNGKTSNDANAAKLRSRHLFYYYEWKLYERRIMKLTKICQKEIDESKKLSIFLDKL